MSDRWDRAWPTLMQWDDAERPPTRNGALFTREMIAKAMERYGAPDRVVISTAPRHGKTAAYRAMREMMERGLVALPDPIADIERAAEVLRRLPAIPVAISAPWRNDDDAFAAMLRAPYEDVHRRALARTGRILVSWLIGRGLRRPK